MIKLNFEIYFNFKSKDEQINQILDINYGHFNKITCFFFKFIEFSLLIIIIKGIQRR